MRVLTFFFEAFSSLDSNSKMNTTTRVFFGTLEFQISIEKSFLCLIEGRTVTSRNQTEREDASVLTENTRGRKTLQKFTSIIQRALLSDENENHRSVVKSNYSIHFHYDEAH